MFNKQSILNLENYGINKTMSIPRLKSLDDSKFCIFKIDGEKIKTSPEFQTGKLSFTLTDHLRQTTMGLMILHYIHTM